MTEYEIYSYETYRKKYQDDIRPVSRGTLASLDQELLLKYIELLKEGKPRLAKQNDETICELMSITAIVVPGTQLGIQPEGEARFLDNRRIEGTIPEMLQDAIKFVKRNMRTKTIIDAQTGEREDRTDYPIQSRVMPLVETGQLKMSIPEKPKSPKQLFYSE